MTYLYILVGAHIALAIFATLRLSRFHRLTSGKRAFAAVACWLIPVIGSILVLATLRQHHVPPIGHPNQKYAAEYQSLND